MISSIPAADVTEEIALCNTRENERNMKIPHPTRNKLRASGMIVLRLEHVFIMHAILL